MAGDFTLVKRRLAVWRYVVCVVPAYLEKHAPPQSPADLAARNCLPYTHLVFGHDWPSLDADNNGHKKWAGIKNLTVIDRDGDAFPGI